MENKLNQLKTLVKDVKDLKKESEIKEVDVEFMSDSSAAMLQGVPIRYHIILISAVLFLAVALFWASIATLDVVTVAQGKVIPSRNMQIIQNLEGGIVKDIKVKVGELVEPDQVLMIIDDTQFTSKLKEGEIQAAALQAKLERLIAETKGMQLEFSEELNERFPQFVAQEQSLFNSRVEEFQTKLSILKDEVEQHQQELMGMQGKKEQLERSLALVERELTLTKPLLAQGAVSEVDLLKLERTVNDLRGELQQTVLAIPRLEAALSSSRRKLDELQISFRTEAQRDLNTTRAEYVRIVEMNRASQDRVTRSIVRSMVKGAVNEIKVNTIGGVVQPGQELMSIVPLEDRLLIEANVSPQDIGFLRPGLPAIIKISAYDFSIYGGLDAVVMHISADTITDEKGNSFYQIRAETTDKSYLTGKQGEQLQIIPGMSATVDILTGQRTVLEYLLKPIIKAKREALRER